MFEDILCVEKLLLSNIQMNDLSHNDGLSRLTIEYNHTIDDVEFSLLF